MLWAIGALALGGLGWGLFRHFGSGSGDGADSSSSLWSDGGSSDSGSGDSSSSDSGGGDSGGE
ncbi:MAG: hypothetical protein AB7O88_01755 [Reyranellaceae bacterium]